MSGNSQMSAVQVWRWTRQEYERMTEAGVLTENDGVGLIGGEILTVTPQTSRHATARWRTKRARRTRIPRRIRPRGSDGRTLTRNASPTESIPLPFGGVVSTGDLLP